MSTSQSAAGPDDPILPAFSKAPERDNLIPDRPFGLSGTDLDAWRWHAPGTWTKTILGKTVLTFTAPGEETAE